MASSIMNHPVFISEKLAIITCSGEVTSRAIRNYMLKNWNVLSQGLDNSSILIMAGVHVKPQTFPNSSRRCGLYVSTGGPGPLVAYADKGAIRELIGFSACV